MQLNDLFTRISENNLQMRQMAAARKLQTAQCPPKYLEAAAAFAIAALEEDPELINDDSFLFDALLEAAEQPRCGCSAASTITLSLFYLVRSSELFAPCLNPNCWFLRHIVQKNEWHGSFYHALDDEIKYCHRCMSEIPWEVQEELLKKELRFFVPQLKKVFADSHSAPPSAARNANQEGI